MGETDGLADGAPVGAAVGATVVRVLVLEVVVVEFVILEVVLVEVTQAPAFLHSPGQPSADRSNCVYNRSVQSSS